MFGPVFVHSGAARTDMRVNSKKNFVIIFMVQIDGEWPNNSKEIMSTFYKAGGNDPEQRQLTSAMT